MENYGSPLSEVLPYVIARTWPTQLGPVIGGAEPQGATPRRQRVVRRARPRLAGLVVRGILRALRRRDEQRPILILFAIA